MFRNLVKLAGLSRWYHHEQHADRSNARKASGQSAFSYQDLKGLRKLAFWLFVISIFMKTETFFKYLKQEKLSRRHFKNLIEVKQAVFQYIEGFYNPRRPHSANNLLAPDQKEAKYFSESN